MRIDIQTLNIIRIRNCTT